LLPEPKCKISLINTPSVKQICSSILSQLISFCWDDQLIACHCPFCIRHEDQLVLNCFQQHLIELNAQLRPLLKH